MDKKYLIAGAALLSAAVLGWLLYLSTRPLPGTKITDLGRGHIEIGTEVKYNSNPPTSGQHYEDWVRAGIYTEVKDDRNLVHSLEHGYVIMHYRCNIESRVKSQESSEATWSAEATPSGKIDSQVECDERKAKLEEIYNKKGKRKLIVVVRPNLDTNFAVTAWNYLDKFDPSTSSGLSVSEVERIEKFIDTHLDNGSEKTM